MNKKLGWAAIISASIGSGVLALLSPDTIENFVAHLSDSSQSQFSKNLFIFSLAAVIHSGRMKKEIRANFEMLVASIDNVSKQFHSALESQSKKQDEKLDGVIARVETLEAANKQK